MRRLLVKILSLIVGVFGTILMLVYSVPDRSDYTHAIIDKHRLLETTQRPRIIFVGGSGLAFGLDSPLIRDSLGRNVINMGLHGLCGLRFMVEQVRPSLQSTDLVVLCPEYLFYYGDQMEGIASEIVGVAKTYPQSIAYVSSIEEGVRLLKGSTRLIQSKCTQIEEMVLHITRKRSFIDSVYSRSSFNDRGDVVSHIGAPPYFRDKGFYRGQPGTPESMSGNVVGLLNDFALSARKKGATVYLLYPAFPDSLYEIHEQAILQLDWRLRSELMFEVLASPREYIFPNNHFYDSIYHLDGPGRHERTLRIIAHLKKRLSEAQ